MTFVFYDTETTGTDTAFDQILQFGAIRTDDDLNEIDRFEIRCRLLPHIVPAPMALKVTGITPEMLTGPALPSHYEAMRQVHAKLSDWSPSVFVGYNSISFDENLLRQAFYQTLQPIYLTNTGGNTRADMLRIAHAVAAMHRTRFQYRSAMQGSRCSSWIGLLRPTASITQMRMTPWVMSKPRFTWRGWSGTAPRKSGTG